MSTVWPQIGSNIDGDNPDDLFGSSISLSDDGTIVAIGAQWYDGGEEGIVFTAATDLVTIPGHNYSDNDKIGFAGITGGIGLGDGETYYVINKTANTFKLSLIQGPTVMPIDLGGTAKIGSKEFIFVAATNLVTGINHGYTYGATVSFTDVTFDLSFTITDGTVYYVINPTTDTFQLSSSAPSALSIIPILGDGTATTTVTVESENKGNRGSVQVWKNTDGTWGQLGKNIDGENFRDKFGQSVALNSTGTRVASGARGAVDGNGLGRVRVFEYNVGTMEWDLLGNNIDPVDTAETVVLTVSGSTVDYTAHGYNNNDAIRFSTVDVSKITNISAYTIYYVVNKTADTFQLSLTYGGTYITFTGSDDNAAVIQNESFHTGWSIALNNIGDIVAIGEPRSNMETGCATLYKLVGSTWTKMGRSIVGHNMSGFGLSISLNADGSTVAIGGTQVSDIGMNVKTPDGGYVGIYENLGLSTTASWIQKGPLIHAVDDETYTIDGSTDFLTRANHGFSDGDQIAFATITTTTGISTYTGYYIINKTDDTFQLSTSSGGSAIGLTGDGSATRNSGDQFGYSVSLNNDGNIVAIGAIDKKIDGTTVGQVKVYKYNGSAWDLLGSGINGRTIGANFGYSVALNPGADGTNDDTFVAIGASGVDHVEIYTYNGFTWSQYNGDILGDDNETYTIDGSTNFLTRANHGFSDGNKIVFVSVTTTTGITRTTDYYVINRTNNTFQLTDIMYTITADTNKFTLVNHGYTNNDTIAFSSIISTVGIVVGTTYHIVGVNGDDFQVATSQGGSAVSLTNNGTATGTSILILTNNGTATRAKGGDRFGSSVSMNGDGTIVAGGAAGGGGLDTYTTTGSSNLFTLDNHGFVDDDRISFNDFVTTSGPTKSVPYYVKSATTNTFQISETTTTNGGLGTTVVLNNDGIATRVSPATGYAKVNTLPSVPGPPTISARPLDSSIEIAFTAGTDNGALATNYEYSIDGAPAGPLNPASTTSPITITTTDGSTPLSNGTQYAIKLRGITPSLGNSNYSNQVTVTPVAVPSKPTIGVITANTDGSVSVAFTSGATGGSAITDYKYKIDSGSLVSVGSTSSPFTISSGLSLGTSNAITLLAVNSAGNGAISDAVSVIPAAVPAAPTITDDTTGDNNSAIIHFTAGASNGRDITDYKYKIDSGSLVSVGSTSSPFTISSLINGISYNITLFAVNEMGTGAVSNTKAVIPAPVPDSPVVTGAVPGNSKISMTFTVGQDNGSDIIRYEYSINTGSNWSTVTLLTPTTAIGDITPGTTATFDVGSLSNGTPYVVMLRSVNATGTSSPVSSSSVIPVTTPSSPTNVVVSPGNQEAIVTYDNSDSDGGSVILYYQYSIDNGINWTQFLVFTLEEIPRPKITGLTNNKDPPYQVRVRAFNAVGGGTQSSPAIELIPLLVPGAPFITGIIPSNKAASVEFTAGDAFGTTITNYDYSTDAGITWTTRSPSDITSPIQINELNNGQTYQVRIRAVNSNGVGTSSNASIVQPTSSPTAPTVTSVTPGDEQISINFTPGAVWGSPAVNYQYSFDNGNKWVPMNPAQTTSPLIITGLTNGTSYTVIIRTVRSYGPDDSPSSPTVVIPATVPDAPRISVVSGNLSAIITITDGSNNGRSITNYQYSIDNGSTWTIRDPASIVSPLTLTGLEFNQTYQIKLKSYNQMGWGAESVAESVTIAKKPDAPIIDSTTASNEKVTIAFTAGNSNNLPLTNYKYSTDNGVTLSDRSPVSTTSPLEITGLTNGSEYKIILYAINNAGVGTGSETQIITLPSPPDAPTIVVNPGYESLSISITPGKDNGSPITNYQYTIDNGINWVTRSPVSTESPLIIPGLTNGQLYQAALKAINAIGISIASSSGSTIPKSVPGPPTIISATPSDQQISLVFTPGPDNGFTIINYQYSLDNAATWKTRAPVSINSPLEITELINGETSQVRLRATNINGNSPESNLISVAPATYPDPPVITSVTPSAQSAIVIFTAGSNNGATITNYQYSVDNGSTWINRNPVSANSPLIITGLTNGQTYQIKLRAVNSIGYGNATIMYTVTPFSDVPKPVLTVGPNNTIIVPTDGLEVLTNGTPFANRTMRIKFIKALLIDNATLINGNKLLIDTKTLLGESTTITKQYVRILNTYTTIPDLPTVERFNLSTLEPNEGIYAPIANMNDSLILQIEEGNLNWFMKFVKATVTQYQVYEDYGNINTPVTSVKTIGDSGNYRYFSYIIDSVSGEYNPPPSPVPICFPKGTPVSTDQGDIDIEKIIPNVHTIRGKQIMAITKTVPNHTCIVSISQDAFERSIPSKTTRISQEHKVVYKGRLMKAKDLVNCCEGVTMIPYDGKPLYNVLMKQYDYMMINNLTCETLHPESIMSKIYNGKFTYTEQTLFCSSLTNVLASNNTPAYIKLCDSIRFFEREKKRGRNVDIRVGYHGVGSTAYSKQK